MSNWHHSLLGRSLSLLSGCPFLPEGSVPRPWTLRACGFLGTSNMTSHTQGGPHVFTESSLRVGAVCQVPCLPWGDRGSQRPVLREPT